MVAPIKKLSFTKILLVSFFLGFLGVDRYLLGYKNWWLKTITLGGFMLWALWDLVGIATMRLKMADGSDLE
jgi:hypothetical protein